MKRSAVAVIAGILSVGVAAAQSASEAAQQPNTTSPGAAQEPRHVAGRRPHRGSSDQIA
jgi:hypothetical protein